MSLKSKNARAVAPLLPIEPALKENARKVLEARYLKKDESGACTEKPAELFRRVAKTIADVETQYGASERGRSEWETRFYNLMTTGDFMPNSPTLMNAGREMGMLSACFVLPVRDSITEIFNSIKHTALIQKAGGGTGFAFDELRPTGDFISSSGGTTSGPISFWRAFSEATNAIQQGAFRRGANMGMMYIHHPDILKFLHAKQDLSQFTNYNISVKVTDAWMDEYLEDPDSAHLVRNPRTGQAYFLPRDLEIWKYDVRNLVATDDVHPIATGGNDAYIKSPRLRGAVPAELRGKVYTKRDIWDFIVQNAWQTGEPGVVFIDRIAEHNPTPHVGRMEATNPCGEQPLLPYEACNLGSVNLANFINDGCTEKAAVDWDRLRTCIHESIRFLDNVIDANNYPLAEIDAVCKANRKIGLGVMGFADALYKLNVAYNSDDGVAWGERFMKFLNDESHNYSEQLARTRGCFPNWPGSLWQTTRNRMQRNACSTTVAPTGTISIIANCSGGIEPMFSLAFIRNVLRGQKQGEKPLVEVNEIFCDVARARGFYSDDLMERLAREGTLAHIDQIPDDIRRVFVCAHDIDPIWHMKMQAAFQQHCDASISKTINFPHESKVADVNEIYMLAYEMGCKGVTVYRDRCREMQPMALKNADAPKADVGQVGAVSDLPSSAPVSQPLAAIAIPAAAEPAIAAIQNPNSKIQNGNGNGHSVDAPLPIENRKSKTENPAEEEEVFVPAAMEALATLDIEPKDLPEIVSGLRIRQMTPFGNMHVKITVDPRSDRELEIFAQLGKGGDVANSDLEGMCRIGSLWLRAGGSLKHIIKQLDGIGSSMQIPTKAGRIMSLPDGLATALKKYQRAKDRWGLRALLLGEVDLAELDRPARQPAHELEGPPQQSPERERVVQQTPERERAVHPNPARECGAPAEALRSSTSEPVLPVTSRFTVEPGDAPSSSSIENRKPKTDNPEGGRLAAYVDPANPLFPAVSGASSSLATHNSLLATPPAGFTGGADAAFSSSLATHNSLLATPAAAAVVTAPSAAVSPLGASTLSIENRKPKTENLGGKLAGHDVALGYKVHCPSCDSTLAMQEGCRKCHSCGWSAC